MEILHLTLKKKWYDLIANGQKKEEYRELKPYWRKRLFTKKFDVIKFRNGYSKDAPTVIVELKEIAQGLGSVDLGAPESEIVYILKLGNVIKEPEPPKNLLCDEWRSWPNS